MRPVCGVYWRSCRLPSDTITVWLKAVCGAGADLMMNQRLIMSPNSFCSGRYAKEKDMVAGLSARKILDVAMNAGDPDLFYTTFRFFEERNYRTKGKVDFMQGKRLCGKDACSAYATILVKNQVCSSNIFKCNCSGAEVLALRKYICNVSHSSRTLRDCVTLHYRLTCHYRAMLNTACLEPVIPLGVL